MFYDIKRNGVLIANVWPDSGQQEKEIMLKDIVTMSFSSHVPIHFQIGDYVDVWGERYYLNYRDEVVKESTLTYKYTLGFQAARYALAKPIFFFYNSANVLNLAKFEIMATPSQFLDLIVANANRTQSGWTRGDCVESQAKYLAFDGERVLQALDQLAMEFETEWWIINKVIHLSKKEATSGYSLEYGYDKGLRGGLERTNVSSASVFSRLYVTGSEDNLPTGYRNGQPNLMLPAPAEYIQGPLYSNEEIEAVINFPEIKPERIGTVTSVGNKFQFSDAALDFNINDQLISGVKPKVEFISGQLSGFVFEIAEGGYNHATKTITILETEQEKNFKVPTDLLRPAVGDQWTISDLVMPPVYISNAESKLLAKGQAYFDKESKPKVEYQVPPDQFFFARVGYRLNLGHYVHVKDFDLELDKDIRILAFNRDLHDEFKYGNLRLSDINLGSQFIREVAEAEKTTKALQINKINNIQRARQNWRTTNELTTMLDTVKTEMLLVIVPGGAYQTNIVSETNSGGNVNGFASSAGSIVHEEYLSPGTWSISAYSVILPSAQAYYVYIRASRVAPTATLLISAIKIGVESDSEYYFFPYGIISTPYFGRRIFTSTKGYTRITANQINTGRIASNSTSTFIDLDTGEIKGKFTFTSGADVETSIENAATAAANAQNYLDAVLPGQLSSLQNQIDGAIESYFYQYDPTTANAPANSWTTAADKEKHGNDTFTNTSTGASWRWVLESGTWLWKVITDTATQQALLLAGQAKDTADHKRRVFLGTPYTPYDQGDMWAQGSSGELMRCIVSRAAGAYVASDWDKASKYTDDTVVTALINNLGNMAYDDMVEIAKLGTSIVEGGFIKTVLIDADTIIARNIITATAGTKRVAITGVDNNIQILSAANELFILLDDDCALEYITLSPNDFGAPQIVYHYGPGIAIGNNTLGTTLGRKGYSSFVGGKLQNFIGSPLGNNSDGQVILDTKLGIITNNIAYGDQYGLELHPGGYYVPVNPADRKNIQWYPGLIDGVPVMKWIELP